MLTLTAALPDLLLLAADGGAGGEDPLRWEDLGLRQGIELGFFTIRFYALAYFFGILLGYWQLIRMARTPGSPFTSTQVDSLVLGATLGIILGARLGYAAFYQPRLFTSWELLQPWHGGMSFHGGLIGVLVAVGFVSWREKLDVVRVTDYVAVVVPIGLMLGRIANFINGELWGRPTDVPWAMIFPGGGEVARHPSQLYQATLEGLVLLVVLMYLFWRTGARYRPGLLAGVFAIGVGLSRFIVEFFREPDAQLAWLVDSTGLSMGQWLTGPLVLLGVVLIVRARRRPPVEPDEVPARAAAAGTVDGDDQGPDAPSHKR